MMSTMTCICNFMRSSKRLSAGYGQSTIRLTRLIRLNVNKDASHLQDSARISRDASVEAMIQTGSESTSVEVASQSLVALREEA